MNRAVQSYGRQQSASAAARRKKLVEDHATLVRRVAHRIGRMAPNRVAERSGRTRLGDCHASRR